MANPDTGLAPWPPGIIGDTQNYTMFVASVPWQPPLTLQGEGNVGGVGGECLFILEFKPPRCPAGNPSSLPSLPSSPGTHEKSSFQKKTLKLQEGREAARDLNALGGLWGPWSTTVVQGVSIGARLTLAADHWGPSLNCRVWNSIPGRLPHWM